VHTAPGCVTFSDVLFDPSALKPQKNMLPSCPWLGVGLRLLVNPQEATHPMIHVYGKGRPGDLVRPIFHHARGLRDPALAILAGLWVHELHTDESRHHELHFGKGANGLNLYLDNGERFAFRGGFDAEGYDRVKVHRGTIRPLGEVVLELRDPEDTADLWILLSEAARTRLRAAS
jgi:hypothetical protein